MSIPKIIEQIQKLLALAASSTFPDEVANALDKVRILKLKYDISDAQINTPKNDNDIIEIDFGIAYSASNYTIRLAYWLCQSFNVTTFMINRNVGGKEIKFEKSIRFIGRKSDVSIATFVYCYVCAILDSKSKEYYKERKTKKRAKEDFSLGFIDAVCQKLNEIKIENDKRNFTPSEVEQINALVVTTNALVNQYIKDKYGDDNFNTGGKKINIDNNSYCDGFEEGQKVGIFAGIEEHSNNRKEIK